VIGGLAATLQGSPLRTGDLVVPVAALADIIRSNAAANRPRDRAMLPTLRALLERSRQRS
jgi:hypothetical protein